jgi:hypothetical protein
LLICLLACASGPNAVYSGATYPVVASPEAVAERNQTPADQVVIGEVMATCEMSDREDLLGIFDNRSCKRAEMTHVMKTEASKAGGQTLVARRCDMDAEAGVDFSSEHYTDHSIECHADVARSKALTATSNTPEWLKCAVAPQRPSTPPSAAPSTGSSSACKP